jgi:hypothetical protein
MARRVGRNVERIGLDGGVPGISLVGPTALHLNLDAPLEQGFRGWRGCSLEVFVA